MNTPPYPYPQIAAAIEHLVTQQQAQPTLAELAERANLSPFHFQRLFTEWAGVSPKKFGQYLTLDYAKQQLRNGAVLSAVADEAGLSGAGRLHDPFVRIEGVTPGQFKQGGRGLLLHYGVFDSPFGPFVLGSIGGKVALLHFLTDDNVPEALLTQAWPKATLVWAPTLVRPLAEQIFPSVGAGGTSDRPRRLAVLMRGTAFQLKVWEALLSIPEGHLASYDQIAATIGQPTATRAVGTAIGANPVGYLIPCHRVIKKTGLFGGYRWGSGRKQAILGWEAARRETALLTHEPGLLTGAFD
ncbi:transcriptional regulator, AraC family [Fibrella aestuarina BUZ 2]|uniref:methylated-DNA--[protein]-cysteine S-methyltransferase n=1 Tax=Fibrella aestuarina BUZ 2 TaxID=1166018 RepID=I0KCJ7_9BACT|nr:methylated-DNA--[protein]-cysteine S-methyltransferase [Fibrella aestuarina]CCH01850.1 transcriptional regulator, AraC family [Fibrella aestuarina BUZ 2]